MAQPYVGKIVLVSLEPPSMTSTGWFPAIVEAVGDSQQIVCSALINGNMHYIEGAKHERDPWWESSGNVDLAVQELIATWKDVEAPKPRGPGRPKKKSLTQAEKAILETSPN
jgi:hypothetical protein